MDEIESACGRSRPAIYIKCGHSEEPRHPKIQSDSLWHEAVHGHDLYALVLVMAFKTACFIGCVFILDTLRKRL